MTLTSKMRVAVLRGGPSSQYDTSLKSGHQVLSILREIGDDYDPVDIFISKDGDWHRDGLVYPPHQALKHADVVWNALHGEYGEDGQVQQILEGLRIPFTGPSSVSAALSMNKDMAKKLYERSNLPTPRHEIIKEDYDHDHLIYIFRNYLHPVIVKPASGTGSLGVRLARTFIELENAVREAFQEASKVLVEEFIKGHNVSCAVIDNVRGERVYSLLPRSEVKLRVDENKKIESMAKLAHQALGLRHYSGSDFIITPKKKIYILETNSLPALHEESAMKESLSATGWHLKDFMSHVLSLAL